MKIMFCILVIGIVCALLYSAKTSAVSHKAKVLRVKDLLRASLQWYTASKKDIDELDSLAHSSRSSAYLEAARAIMSDEEISSFYNNIDVFAKRVAELNDRCVHRARAVLKACG